MVALKRGIDVVLGMTLLVAVLPLLAALAIAIWVETGAPVLFRGQRLGRGGRPFTMYKFRTMARGSERALETLRSRNVAQGMVKIADDPRVTPLGRLLRRFSLDELPQLWNVVRGEMSLVGPRPHELARTNPSLAIRVHYDLEYIARWSLLADFAIALKTIPVVLQGEGGRITRLDAADLSWGHGTWAGAARVHGQDLVPEVSRGDGPGHKTPGVEGR